MGRDYTCALLLDGTVKCWGFNGSGQLGDGTKTSRAPTAVPGLSNVAEISPGGYHTCARLKDATVKCWGENGQGQLGDGTTDSRLTPTTVPGLTGVTQMSAGYRHTCALLADGTVRCWGYNNQGQLGDGSTTNNHSSPSPVLGLGTVKEVRAGGVHTCAVLADGTVKCWGAGLFLGPGGGGIPHGVASPAPASPVVSVATTAPAATACVGIGCADQLFDDFKSRHGLGDAPSDPTAVAPHASVTPMPTPIQVPGLSNVTNISMGNDGASHTCARLADSTVRCWGYNDSGQLGDGTTANQSSPVSVVGLTGVADVQVNVRHSCARLTDGTVKCWGTGMFGVLGDGTMTNRPAPTVVAGLTHARQLSVGISHACVLGSTGTVDCWGSDEAGQLGQLSVIGMQHCPTSQGMPLTCSLTPVRVR